MLKQAQLSDQQQATTDAHNQLQQQQERNTDLQSNHDLECRDAAAAAAATAQQLKQGQQLVQQLQEELVASQQQEQALQDSCNAHAKQVDQLTSELSTTTASAKTAQVGTAVLVSLHAYV